jgi:hypothetical protein
MRTPARATFTVVDSRGELKELLPDELYSAVLQSISEEPLIEDLDV